MADSGAWPIDTHVLRRRDVDRRYQLWVAMPMGYRADASQPYPLVVCCDAPWTFGTAVDTTRILSMSRETPRCVVAGIAHDTTDTREMLDLRAVDYTVTPAEAPPMTGIRAPAAETGQAEPFRQWLAGDVMPLLYDRYHVGEPTYVGHSFTALFGLHVLFNAPDMFARYLLASPSVWWDREEQGDGVMFRLEAEHAAAGGDPAVKVFMSMGEHETDEYSPQARFHDQFSARGYRNIDLTWHVFPGENHNTVVGPAVSRGLRALYAD